MKWTACFTWWSSDKCTSLVLGRSWVTTCHQ